MAVSKKTIWKNLVEKYGVTVPKEQEERALDYAVEHFEALLADEITAHGMDLTPKEYAYHALANNIKDGAHMRDVEVTDLGNGLIMQTIRDQEIIEVDQDELKRALQTLMTNGAGGKMAETLKEFYERHAEYNGTYFHGLLSQPLITIEKMDNRTLGNYTHGQDEMGITNHLRLNVNFVALNTRERVLETLRHEMIHQWQDEVLYKEGKKPAPFKRWVISEEAAVRQEIEETPKKRPKDWHNRDFKQMAAVVGIPAEGDKCYGNPAKMPEPKSYNRKFVCGCVASNGHPLTIWSTRGVNATCKVCKQDYVEVKKGGRVIQVAQSHVEKPGEDAVMETHKDKYSYFERFRTKEAKDDFVKTFEEAGRKLTDMAEGVYQKGHNAYREGFTHWVAFNAATASGTPKPPRQLKKPAAPKAVEPPKPAKPKKPRSHTNPQDLIDLYIEYGTIKAVADHFGVVPGTIIAQAKKHDVDFKQIKGEIQNG